MTMPVKHYSFLRNTPSHTKLQKGRVAEWLMAPVLKTGVPERVSGVRIHPLPPFSLLYCSVSQDTSKHPPKSPEIRLILRNCSTWRRSFAGRVREWKPHSPAPN